MQNDRKTFGLGLKIGPVFIGTDYMFWGLGSKTIRAVSISKGNSLP